MRELKDSTQAPPPGQAAKTVNFLCRVERKTGGTVWLECTGRLYIEPGKGRKAVILSGRERVMPKLEWSAIGAMGGIGGGTMEGWGMMSFEGLVLYANGELKDIFGAPATDGLLGESLLDYIPPTEGGSSKPNASSGTTVSPAILNTPFQEPIHQRMLDALKLASRGQPAQSGVTIRHQIVVPCGALSSSSSGGGSSSSTTGRLPIVQEVATTIYAIQRDSREYLDLASSPGQHQQLGGSGGSARSPFGSENTESFPIEAGVGPSQNKLRQTALVFQVKLLSARPQAAGQPPRPTNHTSFQTAHEPTADVFEALDTNRSTGWTYELHQLKIANRKLKEEIAQKRAGKSMTDADDAKSRRTSGAAAKRKRDAASGTPAATTQGSTSQSPAAAMPPPPLPQQQQQQQQQAAYAQSWADPYGSPVEYGSSAGQQQQYSTAPPGSSGYYSSPPSDQQQQQYLPQMAYPPPPHGHGTAYGGSTGNPFYDSY